jgi:hypothetical protein
MLTKSTFPFVILLLTLFSCERSPLVGSEDVVVLEDAVFTITDRSTSSSTMTVEGTVTNTGDDTFHPPWYIEAEFYSDSTFSLKFGGSSTQIRYTLAPGEQTLWKLTYSSNLIVESDYPDFAVKNLRAFVNK